MPKTKAQKGAVIDKLSEAGAEVEKRNGAIRIRVFQPLRAMDVTTLPFPN